MTAHLSRERRRRAERWLKAIIRSAPDADDDTRLAWAVTALVADGDTCVTEAAVVAGLENPDVVSAAHVLLAKAVR